MTACKRTRAVHLTAHLCMHAEPCEPYTLSVCQGRVKNEGAARWTESVAEATCKRCLNVIERIGAGERRVSMPSVIEGVAYSWTWYEFCQEQRQKCETRGLAWAARQFEQEARRAQRLARQDGIDAVTSPRAVVVDLDEWRDLGLRLAIVNPKKFREVFIAFRSTVEANEMIASTSTLGGHERMTRDKVGQA